LAIERMVLDAAERFGRLDVLVNNAGIPGREVKVVDLTADDWDEVYRVNLRAPALCARAAAAVMKGQGGGVIVNVASISGILPLSRLGPYSATKAGLIQLTKVMALELAPLGIRVNAVCPGYFSTPMNEEFFADPARREAVERGTALRRLGSPEELAPIVTMLASDGSSYMTGAVVVVDGGLTLK
jgi:gluconate 5-dehydrogenase